MSNCDPGRLGYISAVSAREALAAGSLTAAEYTAELLNRIERNNSSLGAFLSVFRVEAIKAALRADQKRARGQPLPPLHGLPFAIKDLINVRGSPTTACSRMFANHVARRTALVVRRMVSSGAVLLGKLSLDECGIGSPFDESPWPTPKNPWNFARTPGGSSSGCAVALAAGLVPLALGTDTAGSVRAPAAYCGIVALKPTRGRVSRDGVLPLAPTLDHIGLMARTANDCGLMFSILVDSARRLPRFPPRGTGIGVLLEVADGGEVDAETRRAIETACRALEPFGVSQKQLRFDALTALRDCNEVILNYEAYRVHRPNLESCAQLYGETARHRLMRGAKIDQAAYFAALAMREKVTRQMDELLGTHDVIVTPVALGPATPLDDAAAFERSCDVLFRAPFNVTGHPAISLCVGFNTEGLPLAMQMIARRGDDERLLQLASAYQTITSWHECHPREFLVETCTTDREGCRLVHAPERQC